MLSLPRLSRRQLKPYLAEFLGTLLLIILGDGVVAQVLLSSSTYGNWLSINLTWASAVVLTTFLSTPPPAINPAMTLVLALIRPEPGQWTKVPGILLAQFTGAFVGAGLVYLNYRSAIRAWDPEFSVPGGSILSPLGHHSAGIFATYPSAFLQSNWEAVEQEVLGAAVLMFGVLAVGDSLHVERFGGRGCANGVGLGGVFLLLLGIGAALGWQTGYVSLGLFFYACPDRGPRDCVPRVLC